MTRSVPIKLFASIRDLLGAESIEFPIESSQSVSQLRLQLASTYPESAELLPYCRFAVDQRYVGEDFELGNAEEIAIIPPVSGG